MIFIFLVLSMTLCFCGRAGRERSNGQTLSHQDSIPMPDPLYSLGNVPISAADSALLAATHDSVPVTYRVRTSDWLYYKGKRYILTASPLRERFSNYETFFPFLPIIVTLQYALGLGYDDKPYAVRWILEGDRLYLADIDVGIVRTEENPYPKDVYGHTWKEIYAITEQETGARFDRTIPVSDSTGLYLRYGLMPADWFDGSVFVKQYFNADPRQNTMEEYEEWEQEPFQQLIFRNGRLLRVVNRPNKPMYIR